MENNIEQKQEQEEVLSLKTNKLLLNNNLNNITEEKLVKLIQPKDLLREMRGLLNNYPAKINFVDDEKTISVMRNLILVYDLLVFCRNKTNSEEIKNRINSEMAEIEEKLDLIKIRSLVRRTYRDIKYLNHRAINKLDNILNENSLFIYSKLQYYILAIPGKGKMQIHMKTTHGLPGAFAEEYESGEIEEGASISDEQTFKVSEEGKVIPLE